MYDLSGRASDMILYQKVSQYIYAMHRLKKIVQLLQGIHGLVLGLVLILFLVAVVLNFSNMSTEYDSKEFANKMPKIALVFSLCLLFAQVFPYLAFGRSVKRPMALKKKVNAYFLASVTKWSLLLLLAVAITVIFFLFPHVLMALFYFILITVLVAQRPTLYQLADQAGLLNKKKDTQEV